MEFGASVSFSPVVLFRRCFPVPWCTYYWVPTWSTHVEIAFHPKHRSAFPTSGSTDFTTHATESPRDTKPWHHRPGPVGGKPEKTWKLVPRLGRIAKVDQ